MKQIIALLFTLNSIVLICYGQGLPSNIVMKNIEGGTFTMGSGNIIGSPNQIAAAPEHQVTLSHFSMSEGEITNEQYVIFLNDAYANGWIEIAIGTSTKEKDKRYIQGTALSSYEGVYLYELDGTRVMKDHDNADGDGNVFTGEIEPENPLNISYIDFNSTTNLFYVKDPHNVNDFNWYDLCNYQDYGANFPGPKDTEVKNDFEDWSGAGQQLSNELEGWLESNPTAAINLPTLEEVSQWPVSFIRWQGANAFAIYYGMNIPTEAQWEYAAKGGNDFEYAVYDGTTTTDAHWNQSEQELVTSHVRASISGTANPFGLYNMGGNAWEWCRDNYVAPYLAEAVMDPFIEENNSISRVRRGGSWNYFEGTMQSSIRFYDDEDKTNDHFSFRVVGVYSDTLSSEEDTLTSDTVFTSIINEEHAFIIYPNPSKGKIFIDGVFDQIEVLDIRGNRLFSQEAGTNVFDLEIITPGIYFIKIVVGERVIVQRIIIE